ncbi:sigma-54 dependent transcriptional regulator [uncultured Paraglaciecola sp.]|uniref:sigma-54-dependent transcriptional regulator n=1 Tax=uncultured Paraglaciecola sp. TaxID=1765024 RepID=UPI00261AC856|nr:sigma-54 dependent transcriptional regulator [uncultured Paraglaciecola sp.]
MNDRINILVVEDDPQQRKLIQGILHSEAYQVCVASSVEEAIVAVKKHGVDCIFSDWKLGSLSGLDLLNYVRSNQPELGFAIATAYGTIAHAVKAVDAGADDYLAKPFQRQELLLCIDKIVKAKQLRSQNKQLTQALSEQQQLVDLVGNAPCMQQVYHRIKRVSNTDAMVLITGESGTGKELAARALHQLSSRQSQAFVAVNCGAIPESLAEAELFGALKGAFTGANQDKIGKLQSADKGTLFLDEIGELPLALQAKVLRFLQEGTITPLGSHQEIQLDVRVLAATHRDLAQMVSEGSFREDLFYRLNIVPLVMPPLRERQEDIPRLINFFLAKSSQRYQIPQPELQKSTLKQLIDYPWPGNVRELSNRIERFVLLDDEQELLNDTNSATPSNNENSNFTLPESGLDWEAFEKQCLAQALERHQGNRTKAAQFLNMSYKAFLYRLDKHGLNK